MYIFATPPLGWLDKDNQRIITEWNKNTSCYVSSLPSELLLLSEKASVERSKSCTNKLRSALSLSAPASSSSESFFPSQLREGANAMVFCLSGLQENIPSRFTFTPLSLSTFSLWKQEVWFVFASVVNNRKKWPLSWQHSLLGSITRFQHFSRWRCKYWSYTPYRKHKGSCYGNHIYRKKEKQVQFLYTKEYGCKSNRHTGILKAMPNLL